MATNPITYDPQTESGRIGRLVPSAWCESWGKRVFDFIGAGVLLIFLAPFMLAVALIVKLTSAGPVIFRHKRCGKSGRPFEVLKFRTMTCNGKGPSVTRSGDARVTRVGKILRKWKIDEFPQLINVVRGEMSLVGPRPDVAEFFERASSEARKVLDLRPGLTGWASVSFRNEEELLAQTLAENLQEFYVNVVLPRKAALDLEYAAGASFISDVRLILWTLVAVAPKKSSVDISSCS